MIRGVQRSVGWLLVSCVLARCAAPKPALLPTAPGAPFPGFVDAYQQATAACRDTRTLTVSMAMSGRAGATRLRGRVDAGFAPPARARLEGIAPFGKPVFILVADGDRGTLLLPREDRLLRDAPPAQIVEALAGVPVGADALRTIVAGCGFGDTQPASGVRIEQYRNEWLVLTFPGSSAYLVKRAGAWQVAGARRGNVTVNYTNDDSGRPAIVALRAETQGRVTAELTLRLSDVEINTTLDPGTFEVALPARPVPLTLEELRRAGPLGGADR